MLEGTKIVLFFIATILKICISVHAVLCSSENQPQEKHNRTNHILFPFFLFFFFFFWEGGGEVAWFFRRNEAGISRRQQSVKGTL